MPLLNNSKPQRSVDQLQLVELLPTPDVQARLKQTWKILTSRVVTKHLSAFKFLRKAVVYHIPHPYTKEMTEKSDIVSIFFLVVAPENIHAPQKKGEGVFV